MQNPILFFIHSSAIVYILISFLLFISRKKGDRSRVILAGIQLFSGVVFALYFILLYVADVQLSAISTPILISSLTGGVMYLIYSIEVISPRWLNLRRGALLCTPIFVFVGIYLISLWAGVKYRHYNSIVEMIPNITHFEVWFRLVLCFFILTPVFYIFFVPFPKKYNNANSVWMRRYVVLITLYSLSYLLGALFAVPFFKILFYSVSFASRLTIIYIELFVRLNGRYISNDIVENNTMKQSYEESVSIIDQEQITEDADDSFIDTEKMIKPTLLFERLDEYMYKNHAWRDPDISLVDIVDILKTNRTTLAQAIQIHGRGNYVVYINKLRVEDFIQISKTRLGQSFQETFYDVGFRSRSTALRGFRRVTGVTPTEYFEMYYNK